MFNWVVTRKYMKLVIDISLSDYNKLLNCLRGEGTLVNKFIRAYDIFRGVHALVIFTRYRKFIMKRTSKMRFMYDGVIYKISSYLDKSGISYIYIGVIWYSRDDREYAIIVDYLIGDKVIIIIREGDNMNHIRKRVSILNEEGYKVYMIRYIDIGEDNIKKTLLGL